MIKSKATYRGICCDSCQEDTNIHHCNKCGNGFADGDIIYCEPQLHGFDSNHYHEDCKPKDEVKV